MDNPILLAALVIAAAAALLATYQLLKGPCAATRAVSLDVLTIITLPLIVAVALIEKRPIYLDVALVYSVLSFLAVASLARYLDRGL